MKEVIFGLISGIIASLGMGGGTILILLLSMFSNLNQHFLQGTNLLFFISTAVVSILMNIKNKNIDYKISKYIIISGIIGSIFGSLLSFKIQNNILRKIFGIFLLFIAFLEIISFFSKYILAKNENNNSINKTQK